jgi:hypothetical protein
MHAYVATRRELTAEVSLLEGYALNGTSSMVNRVCTATNINPSTTPRSSVFLIAKPAGLHVCVTRIQG